MYARMRASQRARRRSCYSLALLTSQQTVDYERQLAQGLELRPDGIARQAQRRSTIDNTCLRPACNRAPHNVGRCLWRSWLGKDRGIVAATPLIAGG